MVLCMLHKLGFRAIYPTECSQLSMVASLVYVGVPCTGVNIRPFVVFCLH